MCVVYQPLHSWCRSSPGCWGRSFNKNGKALDDTCNHHLGITIAKGEDEKVMRRIFRILQHFGDTFVWTHCDDWYNKGVLTGLGEELLECRKTKEDPTGRAIESRILTTSTCYNCFRYYAGFKGRKVTLRAPITNGFPWPSRFYRPYGKDIKAERVTDPDTIKQIAWARAANKPCCIKTKGEKWFHSPGRAKPYEDAQMKATVYLLFPPSWLKESDDDPDWLDWHHPIDRPAWLKYPGEK